MLWAPFFKPLRVYVGPLEGGRIGVMKALSGRLAKQNVSVFIFKVPILSAFLQFWKSQKRLAKKYIDVLITALLETHAFLSGKK